MGRTEEAVKEVEELISSGKYPIVNLSILDNIKNLYISNKTKNQIEYTYELYQEYYQSLHNELNQSQLKLYLNALKASDILDNQLLEEEDSFLISLYSAATAKNNYAIDSLMSLAKNNQELTKEDFIAIHDKLLKGTSSESKIGLRTNNLKYVGSNNNGNRTIQYFPLPVSDIDTAIDKYLKLYNSDLNANEKNDYDIFLKPIICHGLIATLQLFNDGNTRYARLIQHVELWKSLNKYSDLSSPSPTIYCTRQYFPLRDKYRHLILDIATTNSEEAWNNWIIFNLKRFQDNLFNSNDNIEKIKRYIKK